MLAVDITNLLLHAANIYSFSSSLVTASQFQDAIASSQAIKFPKGRYIRCVLLIRILGRHMLLFTISMYIYIHIYIHIYVYFCGEQKNTWSRRRNLSKEPESSQKSLTSIVCAEANFSRVRKEWQKFSLLWDGERHGN